MKVKLNDSALAVGSNYGGNLSAGLCGVFGLGWLKSRNTGDGLLEYIGARNA